MVEMPVRGRVTRLLAVGRRAVRTPDLDVKEGCWRPETEAEYNDLRILPVELVPVRLVEGIMSCFCGGVPGNTSVDETTMEVPCRRFDRRSC